MKKPRKRRRGRPPKKPKIQIERECIGDEEEIKEALNQAFDLIFSEPLWKPKRVKKKLDDDPHSYSRVFFRNRRHVLPYRRGAERQ